MSRDGAAHDVRALRPLLFSIAYRMTGSVRDAEDLVQESLLRHHRETAAGVEIASAKAWLTTVVTRLAINHLKSARVARERYVGTWLPEPVLTDAAPDGIERVERDESVSLALLVVLETLNPVERAVFLLGDVLGHPYREIATIVGRREDTCRQIGARARGRVAAGLPRFQASRERRDELARRFFAAATGGDMDGLVTLLARDVAAYGDGGGHAPARLTPLRGAVPVGRLLVGLERWATDLGARSMSLVELNGQPGAVFRDGQGRCVLVVCLEIVDAVVDAVRAVSNRHKLRHLDDRPGALAEPARSRCVGG